jgi:hypothetical protein
MYWASSRQTTRVEDLAYCLLGIFGVHMPLIYGEGQNAFRRLQEEIVKRSNDLTILAWNQEMGQPAHDGLFARSPSNFYDSRQIIRWGFSGCDFSVSNRGLRVRYSVFELPSANQVPGRNRSMLRLNYFLWLGGFDASSGPGTWCVGLFLDKVGPDTYVRRRASSCVAFDKRPGDNLFYTQSSTTRPTFYIVLHRDQVECDPRHRSLWFPSQLDCYPEFITTDKFWDYKDHLFLKPDSRNYIYGISIVYHIDSETIEIVVLCKWMSGPPALRIYRSKAFPGLTKWLRHGSVRKDCPRWLEIINIEPKAAEFTHELVVAVQRRRYLVRASVTEQNLDGSSWGTTFTARLSCRRMRLESRSALDDPSDMSEGNPRDST